MKEAPLTDIREMARERRIPLYATFELTHRCNLSCIHCYLEEDCREELSTEEVFSIINQLAQVGTLEIVFTGGEALIREDFFAIAAQARKNHMGISLLSNGTLIQEQAAEKIVDLDFSLVSISLYGITPETHDGVTKKPGSFSRTVRASKLLRQHGLKVQINTIVMRQNFREIAPLEDFCREIGAEFNPDPLLFATTTGSRKPLENRLGDEDLKHYLTWEKKSGKNIDGLTATCNAGICNVSISPRGRVFPCNALRLEAGDLRDQEFLEIWESSPVLHWLRGLRMEDFRTCFSCQYIERCARCPGHALSEGFSIFTPAREACRISRIRREIRYV